MWEQMDVDQTQTYFQAMETLAAQERLLELGSHDWPNVKRSSRDRIHRDLHKSAFPKTYENPVTPDELAKLLGAGRIKQHG